MHFAFELGKENSVAIGLATSVFSFLGMAGIAKSFSKPTKVERTNKDGTIEVETKNQNMFEKIIVGLGIAVGIGFGAWALAKNAGKER